MRLHLENSVQVQLDKEPLHKDHLNREEIQEEMHQEEAIRQEVRKEDKNTNNRNSKAPNIFRCFFLFQIVNLDTFVLFFIK